MNDEAGMKKRIEQDRDRSVIDVRYGFHWLPHVSPPKDAEQPPPQQPRWTPWRIMAMGKKTVHIPLPEDSEASTRP